MRKLYNELFYIPKHAKVSEKNMLARITLSITVVIACLIAMSISAYAYFSCSVTSASNVIKSASFDVTVSVVNEFGAEIPLETENGLQKAILAEGTYTVKLSKTDTSTAQMGFCIVTLNGIDYHTQQLGSVEFTLKVPEGTELTLKRHWGTSSYYGYDNADTNPNYITDSNGLIDLTVLSADQSDEKENVNEDQDPS